MRQILLILMLFFATAQLLHGQILLSDDQVVMEVAPTIEVFRDSTQSMHLDEVVKAGHFKKNDRENLYLMYHEPAVLWVKIPLVNMSSRKTFLIDIRNATVDDIQFYAPRHDGKGYEMQQVGDAFPYRYRKVFSRAFTFEINIKEGELVTYYLRIHSNGDAINMPLEVWQPVGFLNKIANEKYIFGIYYGSILFIIIFHAFLYVRMRDKALGYYMLYVVGICGFQLGMEGFLSKYFLPDFPWLVNRLVPAFIFMGVATLVGFFQHYFVSKQHLPRLNIVLQILKYMSWMLLLACFTYHEVVLVLLQVAPIFALLLTVTVIAGAAISFRYERVLSIYFMLAFALLVIGAVLNVIYTRGIYIPGAEYGVKLGAGGEIIVFAFALAEKFKMVEERAKATALQHLQNLNLLKDKYNQELEQTVKDRTAALQKSNQNITDSIRYAKRIQTSLLPSEKAIEGVFSDYFVYYCPRDIVSGDFYWFARVGNRVFVAVVDCTGHGVPGAFMSILGINFLNEIVIAKGILDPDKILTQLNIAVKKNLKQTDDNAQTADGMDAALVAYDVDTKRLLFAGAKRPLFYFNKKGELQVLKGSMYPIGGKRVQQGEFELNELSTEDMTSFYLFSDGYADQFGGPEDKKFMLSKFKELLVRFKDLPMSVQHENLDFSHQEWKGRQHQLDDILVIGVKLK